MTGKRFFKRHSLGVGGRVQVRSVMRIELTIRRKREKSWSSLESAELRELTGIG